MRQGPAQEQRLFAARSTKLRSGRIIALVDGGNSDVAYDAGDASAREKWSFRSSGALRLICSCTFSLNNHRLAPSTAHHDNTLLP
jgi:hypothetical protein